MPERIKVCPDCGSFDRRSLLAVTPVVVIECVGSSIITFGVPCACPGGERPEVPERIKVCPDCGPS